MTEMLEKEGLDVLARTEVPHGYQDIQKEKGLVLAIVDSSRTDAVHICENIRNKGNTPIALLVNPKYTDWSEMQSIDTDCYLTETNDDNEMAARVRAVLRRFMNLPRTSEEHFEAVFEMARC
jgi:DNA-binding response OmpR family regulator